MTFVEGDGERLQKVLARAGIGSRRACEELIADGRVTVNGARARLGRRVDPDVDEVEVDAALVPVAEGLVHYLLNKPVGVVTTASDPEGRPTVLGLVPAEPRVFSVGRLDVATQGLIIVTNDGALAHRLTHPRFGVEKEYVAVVRGHPSRGSLRALREGVDLDDGRTAPARVALVAPDTIRITIHEGRNRQVRRMGAAIGHPVIRLVRTRIGPIVDNRLPPGSWRLLSPGEVRGLARAAGAASGVEPAAETAAASTEPAAETAAASTEPAAGDTAAAGAGAGATRAVAHGSRRTEGGDR